MLAPPYVLLKVEKYTSHTHQIGNGLILLIRMLVPCADPENSARDGGGGGGSKNCCNHQRISQRVVRTSLEKQLDPMGPIASRKGSVPYCFKKAYNHL